MITKDDPPSVTRADLLEALGPAPTVSRVARFLDESITTTWRRLKNGELQKIDADGVARITLASLLAFVNRGVPHQINPNRGRKFK